MAGPGIGRSKWRDKAALHGFLVEAPRYRR